MTFAPEPEQLLHETGWVRRLAASLVADRDLADDIAQDAMVAAWQGAPPGEARRPWLVSVVKRLAARVRRAIYRRAQRERLAARPEALPSTAVLAAHAELQRSAVAAVLGLDEPYRGTLLLRFVHGADYAAIAAQHGVSVETVRSRVKRGLALVRARLDGEHGGRDAWALPLTGVSGELAAAGALVSGVVVMSMSKKVVVALAAGLVGLVAWVALRSEGAEDPSRGPESPPVATLTVPAGSAATPEPADGARTVITPAPVQSTASADPLSVEITGRCIGDEDGAGLADCVATVRSHDRPTQEGGQVDPLPSMRTARDGRFALVFRPHVGQRHTLTLGGRDRVPRAAMWRDLNPGAHLDLGEVRLERGHRVAGTVVDRAGVAVAGVHLRLQGMTSVPIAGSEQNSAGGRADATSGDDGRVAFEQAIPAGTWALDSLTSGVVVQEPRMLVVPQHGELRIAVHRYGDVQGVAVDETGAPAAGTILRARLPGTDQDISTARVAKDGRFRLFATRDGATEIDIVPHGDRFTTLGDVPRFRVGSEGVRVVLRRAPAMEVEVIDGETRQPIEDFAVFCTHEKRSSSEDLRPAAQHARGRARVEGVQPGRCVVRIVPTDTAYAVSEPLLVEVGATPPPPRTIELWRRVPRVVRVADAGGIPVAGARLTLEAHRAATNGLRASDPRRGFSGFESELRHRWPELVDRAVTGADGTATLRAAKGARSLTLQVEGEGHLRAEVRDLGFDDGAAPIEVRVTRGGVLEGRVRLVGLETNRVRLRAVPVVPRWEPDLPEIAVGGDGVFRAAALLAGEYDLMPVVVIARRGGAQASTQDVQLATVLARVTVRDGETTTVDLDATALAPGTVRGRVVFDGVPMNRLAVLLIGDPRGAAFGQFLPAADGSWRAEEILPGTYALQVVVFDDAQRDVVLRCVDDEPVVVHPGTDVVRDVTLVRRVLRGRIVDAEGTPVADQVVALESAGYRSSLCFCRTGADGTFAFDPGPLGRVRFVCQPHTVEPSALDIPRVAGEQTVELRVRR